MAEGTIIKPPFIPDDFPREQVRWGGQWESQVVVKEQIFEGGFYRLVECEGFYRFDGRIQGLGPQIKGLIFVKGVDYLGERFSGNLGGFWREVEMADYGVVPYRAGSIMGAMEEWDGLWNPLNFLVGV